MNFEETEDAITLHGLGFLQVKLGANQRLHVWHPALPRRSCFQHSAIHDHRFGFSSRILVGIQRNLVWTTRRCQERHATHIGYLHEGPRTEFGNRPWLPDLFLHVTGPRRRSYTAGETYAMRPYVYHSTEPGGDGRVATLMRKTFEGERGAHSLCEVGITPDADFDRKQWPADRLWEIVRDVLGRA